MPGRNLQLWKLIKNIKFNLKRNVATETAMRGMCKMPPPGGGAFVSLVADDETRVMQRAPHCSQRLTAESEQQGVEWGMGVCSPGPFLSLL